MTASPWAHRLFLVALTALLTLPNLGGPALWDMDEGVNAECAREMMEAGTWIVPTFNWELRSAKPVLLYWLQRASYNAFGVSEWSARFPAALLAVGSVLVTYQLGRRLFDPVVGLLAGVVLASTVQFAVLSHAATPDAPLIFFTTLTFYLVWVGHDNGGRGWFVLPAIPCGLAVLTKGPVGLLVPGAAFVAYFVWNREARRILDWKLLTGVFVYGLVTVPWVAFVTAETRGAWLKKFLVNENLDRVTTAQENHSGPVYYYALCVVVFTAPWSSVIGVTLYYAARATRRAADGTLTPTARAARFLLAWVVAYFVPFSLVATKLPNYVAPLYPALAVLTAWFLAGYARRRHSPPRWVMAVATAGVALTGVGLVAGLLLASGVVPLDVEGMRVFPGLEGWAVIGAIPLAASAVMARAVARDDRPPFVYALSAAAVGIVGLIGAFVVFPVDAQKAPKTLVFAGGAYQPERDIRLATLQYSADNQSLVFYAERRVEPLSTVAQANAFLAMAHPSYLFVPEPVWREHFAGNPATPPHRVTARKYDSSRNAVILVVTNE